jgi:RNA polymerase sigma-70 factor (ECF subfamily)
VRPAVPLECDPEPPLVERVASGVAALASTDGMPRTSFLDVYEEHVSFVWNGVRRLGVPESAVEDVVQEVFLIVHRKLDDFEGRSSMRTWLFGIALRVVRRFRRNQRSRGATESSDVDSLVDSAGHSPHQSAERGQMIDVLYRLLDELEDDKREVLVLSELEQMTAPEIAEITGANLNTVYWRLRTARQEFERRVTRYQARREAGLR